jgi:hypothetical protein
MVLGALAIGLLGACGPESPDTAVGPDPDQTAGGRPYGPGVEVGATYDYTLLTHCGIEWAQIDGVFWQTPLLDDGNANPPAGWDNPFQRGELTVIDEQTAQFRGGPDATLVFRRTELTEPPTGCA